MLVLKNFKLYGLLKTITHISTYNTITLWKKKQFDQIFVHDQLTRTVVLFIFNW